MRPQNGYAHFGPVGAGHYVKMVHNGIEYGMMQAYAEGFEILNTKNEFNLDLARDLRHLAARQRRALLAAGAGARRLRQGPRPESIKGWVADSGEGRWTIQAAIDLDVPAPVITLALFQRFVSRQDDSFAGKVLAAMRHEFGGHAVKSAE